MPRKIRIDAPGTVHHIIRVGLGMSVVDLARKFDLTPAAVTYAVQQGKKMAKEDGYQLELETCIN